MKKLGRLRDIGVAEVMTRMAAAGEEFIIYFENFSLSPAQIADYYGFNKEKQLFWVMNHYDQEPSFYSPSEMADILKKNKNKNIYDPSCYVPEWVEGK